MDYQNRVGNKKGGGGLASSSEVNAARRQRVRELLTDKDLLDNDPYVFRNHLGMLECKLCGTTHISETSFGTHVQGKKHQLNLKRRQHKLDHAQQAGSGANGTQLGISSVSKRNYVKIGTPAYSIKKIRNPVTEQLGLTIVLKLPMISHEIKKPHYRFMSFFEQNVDKPENNDAKSLNKFQYLVISAEPYENICIKIPNKPIARTESDLWDHWDVDVKEYYLQFYFKD